VIAIILNGVVVILIVIVVILIKCDDYFKLIPLVTAMTLNGIVVILIVMVMILIDWDCDRYGFDFNCCDIYCDSCDFD